MTALMQSIKTVKNKITTFLTYSVLINSVVTLPTIIVIFSLFKHILASLQVFLEDLSLVSTES